MANELKIRTPEGVTFALVLAGPFSRMLAWVIDLVILAVLFSVSLKLISLTQWLSIEFSGAVFYLLLLILPALYGMLCEWLWKGQTIGKRLLRLRVIDERGTRLQFTQIVMRNLMRCVDSLPFLYLVGGMASILTERCQRLGDLAAGTAVIRELKPTEPDWEQISEPHFNSLGAVPHLAGRLRQRVGPVQAHVAMHALLRRDEFQPDARVRLFRELATYFRGLVEYPSEITEVLSDEQYVRNVVDVVFKRPNVGSA